MPHMPYINLTINQQYLVELIHTKTIPRCAPLSYHHKPHVKISYLATMATIPLCSNQTNYPSSSQQHRNTYK